MGEKLDQPLDGAPLPPLAEENRPAHRLLREPSPPVPRRESPRTRRPWLDVRIARQSGLNLPVLLLPQSPGLHDLRLGERTLVLDGAGDFAMEGGVYHMVEYNF